ncbi:MAG: hypothetical protein K2Y29_17980 [Beijerinckiaceae bacterium]|nr:hypothetical protein [Beijerinckiaceae bacterium]
MMTQEEAKESWCPFTRLTSTDREGDPRAPAGFNRIDSAFVMDGATCIGGDCMAWRWKAEYATEKPVIGKRPEHERLPSTHGYCGLAGRPE